MRPVVQVCTVVGARPQFVKAAMLSRALSRAGVEETLVHTGQHYDPGMSRVFFEELGLPEPTVNLGVGSASHAVQTGEMMQALEQWMASYPFRFDVLIVFGDTNSTLAAALVAAKAHIPLVHVEAGVRSFNRRMPEEINRIVTDRLSTLRMCPSRRAVAWLAAEGIREGVHWTGDVMHDALRFFSSHALEQIPLDTLVPFQKGSYVLLTAHRPATVDDPERLRLLVRLAADLPFPVVWPVHPRTRTRLDARGIELPDRVHALPPVGYLQMLVLMAHAARILTDSGGIQKEAYWLNRPCLTLRNETEWPETLEDGWNTLVGLEVEEIHRALETTPKAPTRPIYGDGHASDRIVQQILETATIH